MNGILVGVIGAAALACAANLLYRLVNKGLSRSALHQQGGRLTVAAVLAMLPVVGAWLGGVALWSKGIGVAAATSAMWCLSYPLLYHVSNRRRSPDYDNYMDIAAGLYLYGVLSALVYASWWPASVVAAVLETVAWVIVTAQWVYYAMYRTCVDQNGMTMVTSTNYNEVIEFARSYPAWVSVAIAVALAALTGACVWGNFTAAADSGADTGAAWWVSALLLAYAAGVGAMMFGGRRSPWRRTGVVALYLTVKDYAVSTGRYAAEREKRTAGLKVTRLGKPYDGPHTIVMIIGESATRDYMSAFTPMDHDTTPWLRESAERDDRHFLLFGRAYASAMHTVAVLEKALTQFNQYNGRTFYEACSIVDIARAAGYRIHWYSNQGHLGSADTAVTLVADTADRAQWTRQELNKVQYDMSLLDFLDEVDPRVDNLLVLHLKGSHFNFINRYPAEATVWGEPGKEDNELNYMNSVRYTDGFMKRVHDYCRERLNMRAMVYFSDHGTIPTRRRSPGFDGYGHIRIPLAVWVDDDYIAHHPERYEALRSNRDKYFTNDLAYALMCGVMDVESGAYDPAESLADKRYRFTRDMLLSFDGQIRIADDPFDR